MPHVGVIGGNRPWTNMPVTAVYVVDNRVHLGACGRCCGEMVLALDNGDGRYEKQCLPCGNVEYLGFKVSGR